MNALQMTNDNQLIMQQMTSELDVQIVTAKRFPRDIKKAIKISKETVALSKEIASSCIYTLPRAGKNITGASVRLAEIVAQAWGNLHVATRMLLNDGKYITTQAVAWDLETNVRVIVENKRKITDKNGRTYSEDMQTLAMNASASVAMRNAIFKVIPKAILDEVYSAAAQSVAGVESTNGDTKIISQKIERCLKIFSEHGYAEKDVLLFLNKKSKEEITKEDLIMLAGIDTRIKDGDIAPDKAFLPIDENNNNGNVDNLDDVI